MLVDAIPTLLTPAEAEITFVTVPDEPGAGWDLRGRVTGPTSAYGETIEVAYPLKPLPGEGDTVRAKVFIPEPTSWTPATPFLYHAHLELTRGGEVVERATLPQSLKDLKLHEKKGVRLNGQPFTFSGHLGRRVEEATATELHAAGVNLLLLPLTEANLPAWVLANRLGFFIIGQIDPEEEALLWTASEKLNREPSTFGWLLPQSLIGRPQQWHQVASLLHGQRPDVFLGIKVEQLPLGTLPGHVSFAIGEPTVLGTLAAEGLPCLGLVPRSGQPEIPELSTAWLGWVGRHV